MLSAILGHYIGVKNISDLFISGLFHDYGKIRIPDSILSKPGRLNEREKSVINLHPLYGYAELRQTKRLSNEILIGILDHHEKVNGTGYCYGKSGHRISLFGKVIAVIDNYDAMRSQRVYRANSFTHEEILIEIENNTGSSFDEKIVKAFTEISSLINEIIQEDFINDLNLRRMYEMEFYNKS